MTLPPGVRANQLLTIQQASAVSGINHWTLRTWLREKENGLIGYKIKGRVFIRAGELLRWIENNATPV